MTDFRDHEFSYHISAQSALNDVAKVWTAREVERKGPGEEIDLHSDEVCGCAVHSEDWIRQAFPESPGAFVNVLCGELCDSFSGAKSYKCINDHLLHVFRISLAREYATLTRLSESRSSERTLKSG